MKYALCYQTSNGSLSAFSSAAQWGLHGCALHPPHPHCPHRRAAGELIWEPLRVMGLPRPALPAGAPDHRTRQRGTGVWVRRRPLRTNRCVHANGCAGLLWHDRAIGKTGTHARRRTPSDKTGERWCMVPELGCGKHPTKRSRCHRALAEKWRAIGESTTEHKNQDEGRTIRTEGEGIPALWACAGTCEELPSITRSALFEEPRAWQSPNPSLAVASGC